MKWIAETVGEFRSDCGNYQVRGSYVDGNFWRATFVPTGELIVASSDKSFVKLICELHQIRRKK